MCFISVKQGSLPQDLFCCDTCYKPIRNRRVRHVSQMCSMYSCAVSLPAGAVARPGGRRRAAPAVPQGPTPKNKKRIQNEDWLGSSVAVLLHPTMSICFFAFVNRWLPRSWYPESFQFRRQSGWNLRSVYWTASESPYTPRLSADEEWALASQADPFSECFVDMGEPCLQEILTEYCFCWCRGGFGHWENIQIEPGSLNPNWFLSDALIQIFAVAYELTPCIWVDSITLSHRNII